MKPASGTLRASAFAPVLRLSERHWRLLQSFPVEDDVRILRFERASYRFVEGFAADLDVRRCAEPIENPRSGLPAMGNMLNQQKMLVAASVAGDFDERHHSEGLSTLLWPGFRDGFGRAAGRLRGTGRRFPADISGWSSGRPGGWRCDIAAPVDKRETHLITDCVVAPDLVDVNLVVLTQAAGDVHHSGRDVQEECCTQFGEMGPLGERFEMIDRLAGLDLDDSFELAATALREEQKIREYHQPAGSHPGSLFRPRICTGVIPSSRLCLEQPDNPIVLELFADGAYQDRTHRKASPEWLTRKLNETGKSSTLFSELIRFWPSQRMP
jgi:hypothetical protein